MTQIIQNEIQELGSSIINALWSEMIYEKIQWSLSILFLIIIPSWITLLFIQLIFPINLDGNIIVWVLFSLFCPTFLVLYITRRYAINWISSINKHNISIDTIDTHGISIEETLSGFHLIYKNIITIFRWKKMIHWALFYREKGWKVIWENIDHFLEMEITYIYQLLSNLRSDLYLHIENTQWVLKSSKDEIESATTWTNEFESISELQRARLDKQIEQFEKLQKILMRT
jgi:hypothetical protein